MFRTTDFTVIGFIVSYILSLSLAHPGTPPVRISSLPEGSHSFLVLGERTDGSGSVRVGESQFVVGRVELN